MMKRRDFLYLTGAAIATPYGSLLAAAPAKSKYLILNSFASQRVKEDPKLHSAINIVGGMLTYDPIRKKSDVIYIPSFVHSWAQNPVVPFQVVGVTRWTPNALVLNMNRKRVTQKLLAPKGAVFCGYGSYSATGSVIFLPAFDTQNGKTFICVFSAIKWDLAGVLATDDLFPCGCVTLSNGDLAVLHETSGKNKSLSSVTVIDTKTLKARIRTDVPRSSDLTLLEKDQLLLGGFDNRVNLLIFDTAKSQVVNRLSADLIKQHNLLGQPKSYIPVSASAVALTLRHSNDSTIVVWDHQSNTLQKIEVANRRLRGLAVMNGILYVNDSEGKGHQYQIIGTQKPTLKLLADRVPNLGNGDHLKTILS